MPQHGFRRVMSAFGVTFVGHSTDKPAILFSYEAIMETRKDKDTYLEPEFLLRVCRYLETETC